MGRYVLTFLFCSYLIFAIITYLILFKLYKKSERKRLSTARTTSSIFKNSRFYIALIIIGTYLILTVIPCVIDFVWYAVDGVTVPYPVIRYYIISTLLSFTADAFVYILMKDPVRNVLKQKICKCKCSETWHQSEDIEMHEVKEEVCKPDYNFN